MNKTKSRLRNKSNQVKILKIISQKRNKRQMRSKKKQLRIQPQNNKFRDNLKVQQNLELFANHHQEWYDQL